MITMTAAPPRPRMRSVALTACDRHSRQRGAVSIQAAYVLPVVLSAGMMFAELANIGLTILLGSNALGQAIQQLDPNDLATKPAPVIAARLREQIATRTLHILDRTDIDGVQVERITTWSGAPSNPGDTPSSDGTPTWHLSVDIRKRFITPLPRLMGIKSSAFRYRYQDQR